MMRWLSRAGKPMPRDWALTPAGEKTDDPEAAMAGALLGIGGHKGYGLAFMTEALTGILSGGGFGIMPYSDPARMDVSHSFTAIDISWFMPLDEYERRMGEFIDMAKASTLRPGFAEILVPGEQESRRIEAKAGEGVPLDDAVLADLRTMGSDLGLSGRLDALGPFDGDDL